MDLANASVSIGLSVENLGGMLAKGCVDWFMIPQATGKDRIRAWVAAVKRISYRLCIYS